MLRANTLQFIGILLPMASPSAAGRVWNSFSEILSMLSLWSVITWIMGRSGCSSCKRWYSSRERDSKSERTKFKVLKFTSFSGSYYRKALYIRAGKLH